MNATADDQGTAMGDLTNPKLIIAKGLLFLFTALLASALLVAEHPTPKVVLLLVVAVWGFARSYYFAFYVIGRYVDPDYRFAGLWSAARYLWGRRGGSAGDRPSREESGIDPH